MDFENFLKSLHSETPPAALSVYQQSLWYDAKGNWNKAHHLVDELAGNTAALVHAYLHRKEGDMGNADYWYQRAGKTRPNVSLEKEWEDLVRQLSA